MSMPIKLLSIVQQIINEGGKLFGSRSQRVTTKEMNQIFEELEEKLSKYFYKFSLSRSLPSKLDHGDIDILVSIGKNVGDILRSILGSNGLEYNKNGNITSVLYHSKLGKNVHVDFINVGNDYDVYYDYLSFNDFSSIIGIIARKLDFNYSTDGFFKNYKDKKNQFHYILITKNLRDGLKIMGYANVLPTFDQIKTSDDIVKFISSSDLFDSDYFTGEGFNRGDRQRLRTGRKIAQEIRDKLISLNKHKIQEDNDYYFKKLFPQKYEELIKKEQDIENYITPKTVYNGKWILDTFPEIKPGPNVGKIKLHLFNKFGNALDSTPENEVKASVEKFIHEYYFTHNLI